jgi:hypothetical protein
MAQGGTAGKGGSAGKGGASAGSAGLGGQAGSAAGSAGLGGAGSGGAAAGQGGKAQGGAGQGGKAQGGGAGQGGGGQELLENCLRINACEADGGRPLGLQACLAHPLDQAWAWASTGADLMNIEILDCKLAAKDCATVRACSPDVTPYAAQCADMGGQDFCDGDRWVICSDQGAPLLGLDCAARGETCHKAFWAGCGQTPCKAGESPSTCDPQDPHVLLECDGAGFLRRVDCRTQTAYVSVHATDGDHRYSIAGETCGYDTMRSADGCIGTGEACTQFSQKCEGEVLVTCAGGQLGHRDCAALSPQGQGCGFIQTGTFGGLAACGLVNPACGVDDDETCEGGVISFCNLQEKSTLDCTGAGYKGCAQGTLGSRQIAYCTP